MSGRVEQAEWPARYEPSAQRVSEVANQVGLSGRVEQAEWPARYEPSAQRVSEVANQVGLSGRVVEALALSWVANQVNR